MLVVSHLPALWKLFQVRGKREIREAALSPEDDEQSRGQVTDLQLVRAHQQVRPQSTNWQGLRDSHSQALIVVR